MTQAEVVAEILAAADRAGVVPCTNRTRGDGVRVLEFALFEEKAACERGTATFRVLPDGSGMLSHPYQRAGFQFSDLSCLDIGQVLERIAECV